MAPELCVKAISCRRQHHEALSAISKIMYVYTLILSYSLSLSLSLSLSPSPSHTYIHTQNITTSWLNRDYIVARRRWRRRRVLCDVMRPHNKWEWKEVLLFSDRIMVADKRGANDRIEIMMFSREGVAKKNTIGKKIWLHVSYGSVLNWYESSSFAIIRMKWEGHLYFICIICQHSNTIEFVILVEAIYCLLAC